MPLPKAWQRGVKTFASLSRSNLTPLITGYNLSMIQQNSITQLGGNCTRCQYVMPPIGRNIVHTLHSFHFEAIKEWLRMSEFLLGQQILVAIYLTTKSQENKNFLHTGNILLNSRFYTTIAVYFEFWFQFLTRFSVVPTHHHGLPFSRRLKKNKNKTSKQTNKRNLNLEYSWY